MFIRKLEKKDYKKYIELIEEFRPIGLNITVEKFEEIYDIIFKNSIIYVGVLEGRIIGSAKLIIEQKFIHKLSKYGHIEDVIIKKEYRRNKYGTKIINYIVDECKRNKFFKITLTCNEKLISFYEKNNFAMYQIHMSQLL